MKVLNFGSLNVDMVYKMGRFVRGGETLSAERLEMFPGGKGLNQSVALARAGLKVYHAGNVGPDGDMLLKTLEASGVDTRYVRHLDCRSGHAIIQVDDNGENAIILHAGANYEVDLEQIEDVLGGFGEGDCLVLQNEINLLGEIMERAYARGMKIVLNPSPIDEKILSLPLEKVAIFVLNEIEAEQISGKKDPEDMLDALMRRYPAACIALTLGKKGCIYGERGAVTRKGIYKADVVDTTAAGDTFLGYFVAGMLGGECADAALELASKASAMAVSHKGASPSIPWREEVIKADLPKSQPPL